VSLRAVNSGRRVAPFETLRMAGGLQVALTGPQLLPSALTPHVRRPILESKRLGGG
jgi:hypothetical protein